MLRRKRVVFALSLFLAVGAIFAGTLGREAEAAEKSGRISLRILTTADMHGQVTAVNYETNEPDEDAGLGKLATLIDIAKAEVPKENSVLLDAGDFLYDYSTNFFFDNYPEMVQPIMQIMRTMDYDYITLGNHEFDYPWTYLEEQLLVSGLYDKVIVSNLFDAHTGENVFEPSVLFTKNVTDDKGNVIEIKIGIVGATRKGISTRRGRNSNYLYADEIYKYVSTEAQALKKEGADLVVALVHGGTGILSGADTEADPGKRLTALPYVDAVITSHSHEVFPSSDYAGHSGVSVSKGLVNGKPLVATGSHASALGVIDFELSVADGKIKIENASSDLLKVTEDVEEAEYIKEMFAEYQKLLDEGLDNVSYELAPGEMLSNLDCMIADNELYQLMNNAKLEFAKSYISENLPEYLDYPLIAVTANYFDSRQDYIIIEDTISKTDIASILAESSGERDNGYTRLSKITGKNLREWLEYCASFYHIPDTNTGSSVKSKLGVEDKYTVLINPAYNTDEFFVFDGICYEIDITNKARYSATGSLVASANKRITSLTYNGEEVTDDQVFIIALDSYDFHYYFMPTPADTIYVENPWKIGKEVILEYLDRISAFGPVDIKVDNNWSFESDEPFTFLFGIEESGDATAHYIKSRDWYVEHKGIAKSSGVSKRYYTGELTEVKTIPSATVAAGVLSETCGKVPVYVNLPAGLDKSDIVAFKYIKGFASATDKKLYNTSVTIKNNVFYVTENGVYTIVIRDTSGKRYFEYIIIDNINQDILDTPKVNYFSNRLRKVTGTALPGKTVYVRTEKKTYKSKVAEDGSFSVTIEAQKALANIDVWISDGKKNSDVVSLTVRRTGAERPEIVEAEAGQLFIKLRYDEAASYFVKIGNDIYLKYGTKEQFIKSDSYSEEYTITEKPAIRLVSGIYYVIVPKLNPGDILEVYCFDSFGRTGLKETVTVK